jgi:hypothetical protein
MLKYAAATALALITTLTLAVSASVTPANARPLVCGNYGAAGLYCHCYRQCASDAIRRHVLTRFDDKKYQACLSNWVNWFEATRDRRLGHPQ